MGASPVAWKVPRTISTPLRVVAVTTDPPSRVYVIAACFLGYPQISRPAAIAVSSLRYKCVQYNTGLPLSWDGTASPCSR